MYLVDTNVVSEARKGKKANAGVQEFWEEADPADIYISAQTIGEIRRGVENIRYRGDVSQAAQLEAWLDIVVTQYADRVLSFDVDCAQVWGRLMSPHPQHPIDKQIAAIALIHNMTVVTRNVDDFEHTGVQVENPFVNSPN
ncbi:MAG: VapC toxin family PIN domain ribonuclease [Betaproteobacteria bacterium HGW-Betaproteobacteria-22]|nr:MAG: VapC toxin family PIN domain ribonuclease [Betaproteobacteria bacterium HGW-Betaproteobacteria-22]